MPNCSISGLHGRDDNDNLHFYCEFCSKEMDYNEVRECRAKREKCTCGKELGDMDYSVSTCLNCKKEI